MKTPTVSRRDVLKGSTALAASSVLAASGGGKPARAQVLRRRRRQRDHAGADRGGQEGRQGRLVHVGRSAAGREGRQGVRGASIRASPCGSSARGAERVFQRIGQEYGEQHLRGRCRQLARTPRISSSGSATACWRPTCPRMWRSISRPSTRTPTACSRATASILCVDRLQHRSGEGRGRAEELRRSARSEMDGQDRQGASGLQRHHPDRDLPDRARRRLGRISRSSPSRGHAGAVGLRSAEEARARRARDHGRRHRVRRVAAQGERQAGRDRSIRPRARR